MKMDRRPKAFSTPLEGLVPRQESCHPKPVLVPLRGEGLQETGYVPSSRRTGQSAPKGREDRPVYHLACPTWAEWLRRHRWYESLEEDCSLDSDLAISEQACALADAVGIAYCAGAWLAVMRLALDVIDAWPARIWSTGAHGQRHPAAAPGAKTVVERGRKRIKDLVNLRLDSPQDVVDEHWRESTLENEARHLVKLMFACLYPIPCPAVPF
jgi:hypothetical protein